MKRLIKDKLLLFLVISKKPSNVPPTSTNVNFRPALLLRTIQNYFQAVSKKKRYTDIEVSPQIYHHIDIELCIYVISPKRIDIYLFVSVFYFQNYLYTD